MLGLLQILLIILTGDVIVRRFLAPSSWFQRLASAFLLGSLFTAVYVYALALIFSGTSSPLLWANIVYFISIGALLYFTTFRSDGYNRWSLITKLSEPDLIESRPPGRNRWDLAFLGGFFLFAVWLVYATLDFTDGSFAFSIKAWSDFGANLSLTQSFAVGNNYPTEHPFLTGVPIRYHHLFWFLAGNVSYLGLNAVTSINLLSIMSFMSVVMLVMALAEILFHSRVVARISVLFIAFSSSTLSYFTYIWSFPSFSDALSAIWKQNLFVRGFPYRGDEWGSLTISVLAYQRHLISAIGLLLVAVIFLVTIYKRTLRERAALAVPVEPTPLSNEPIDESVEVVYEEPVPEFSVDSIEAGSDVISTDDPLIDDDAVIEPIDDEFVVEPEPEFELPPIPVVKRPWFDRVDPATIGGLLICGVAIGLLPYWNSAVFVSAAIVLAALIVWLPSRLSTLLVFVVSIIVAVPQILYLQSGDRMKPGPDLIYYGWIIPNATLTSILEYITWTFGLKLALLLLAAILATGLHRRLLIAFTGLVIAVFMFQFSIDVFNNHKLLNVWNVLTAAFAAYALYSIGRNAAWRTVIAVILGIFVLSGSIIDVMTLKNDAFVKIKVEDDRLTNWVNESTDPRDIFLTHRFLSHQILFAGRRLFLGNPLFPWAAGYNTPVREAIYKRMLSETDPEVLRGLLKENNVSFVVFEHDVRSNGFVPNLNEAVYQQNFELVFDDTENRYGNMKIYRVPR